MFPGERGGRHSRIGLPPSFRRRFVRTSIAVAAAVLFSSLEGHERRCSWTWSPRLQHGHGCAQRKWAPSGRRGFAAAACPPSRFTLVRQRGPFGRKALTFFEGKATSVNRQPIEGVLIWGVTFNCPMRNENHHREIQQMGIATGRICGRTDMEEESHGKWGGNPC